DDPSTGCNALHETKRARFGQALRWHIEPGRAVPERETATRDGHASTVAVPCNAANDGRRIAERAPCPLLKLRDLFFLGRWSFELLLSTRLTDRVVPEPRHEHCGECVGAPRSMLELHRCRARERVIDGATRLLFGAKLGREASRVEDASSRPSCRHDER